jgi:hypothetical protein
MKQARESFRSRRPDHEVPVIREDAVGENRHRVPFEPLSQNLKELAIISRFEEERRLGGGAVDDVEVRRNR